MNKLAIVGSHPDTRDNAPYDDPDYEIWMFNEQPWISGRRWDVCFQMHDRAVYRSKHNRTDPHHWQRLQEKNSGKLIYMQDFDLEVPASIRYPLESVLSLTSGFTYQKYFETSVSYALALAIHLGYPEIHLYGVEMASQTEYIYQRSSVAFWIGLALGRGIKVNMYCGSGVFDKPLYGYDGHIETKPDELQPRLDELKSYLAEKTEARKAAEKEYIEDNQPDKLGALQSATLEEGAMRGRLAEMEKYYGKAVEMSGNSGMSVISRGEFENAAADVAHMCEKFEHEVERTGGVIDYAYQAAKSNPDAQRLIAAYIPAHLNATYNLGVCQGVYNENLRLANAYDSRERAAGGERAREAMYGDR